MDFYICTEMPSKETLRDESIVLSQTPKLNLESPLIAASGSYQSYADAKDANLLLQRTDLHCETIFGDMDASNQDVAMYQNDFSKVSSVDACVMSDAGGDAGQEGIDDVVQGNGTRQQSKKEDGGSLVRIIGNQEDAEKISLRALNQALKDYITQSNNISAIVSFLNVSINFVKAC